MTRYAELPRLPTAPDRAWTRFGPIPAGAAEPPRLFRDGPIGSASVATIGRGGVGDPVIGLHAVHGPDNPYVVELGRERRRVVEYELTDGTGVVEFAVAQVNFRNEPHRIFCLLRKEVA